VDHPASRIIGDMNERTTWSRVRNDSHFAHAAFVATFEPKDIGHALSDHDWFNSMHEELENFERNQVWELVDPTLLSPVPRLSTLPLLVVALSSFGFHTP
jgi:hypothetical protein